ncbi:MAG: chitobiase/beta-hexosaminidase C-terminal domain-containing protein [Deltaproteobacteria bacterium]|nr:chitobiase/beta-hexosaminidase C-terminal domain-containing protein [Deltaproteobacteria bacterium]
MMKRTHLLWLSGSVLWLAGCGGQTTASATPDTTAPVTTATPRGSDLSGPTTVTLSCADAGKGCVGTFFTADGSEPTTYSASYTEPWVITVTTTLKFFSVDGAGNAEAPQTETYVIDSQIDTAPPVTTVTPPAGAYPEPVAVVISCDDGGGSGCAGTYFTNDGSAPTTSSTLYTVPLAIAANRTLKFFSVDHAGNAEPVKTAAYLMDADPPNVSATPPGGLFKSAHSVRLLCDDGQGGGCAAIYYTTDGSTPTAASARYAAPMRLDAETTVKFFATDTAGNASPVKSEYYSFDYLAPLTFAAPGSGTYDHVVDAMLTCDDGAGSGCAEIYYTLDGSDPDPRYSPSYVTSVEIVLSTVLKFRGVDYAGNLEPTRTVRYLVDFSGPVTTASPAGAVFSAGTDVALTCVDPGGLGCVATYWATDGGLPNLAYAAPIPLDVDTVLSFYSVDANGNVEDVQTVLYFFDYVAPHTVATPAGGPNKGTAVALACNDGTGVGCAATYYTTDGSPPTSSSTLYAGPIPVASSFTLTFFSVDALGYAETPHAETYAFDDTAPVTTASPAGGIYGSTQTVSLSCSDAGSGCVSIYYTTNGTTPTTGSAAYVAPIVMSGTTTLKFLAVDAAGNLESPKTQVFTIDGGAPEIASTDPANGAVGVSQFVVVSITFTEDMNPATLNAATLKMNGGAVPGSVTYYAGSRMARFAPAAPLAGETTYTLSVATGAQDLAGNGLAATAQFSFTTRTPIEQVSGDTSIDFQPTSVAFNNAGMGVAMWTAVTGTSLSISYATSVDGATWSQAESLYTGAVTGYGVGDTLVLTNGTGFMMVWYASYGIKTATVSATGAVSPTVAVGDSLTGAGFSGASNGSGYLLAYPRNNSNIVNIGAVVHNGTSWGPETILDDRYTNSDGVAAAGNASGYLVAYRTGGLGRARFFNNSSWATEQVLTSVPITYPFVAASAASFCVAYDDGADKTQIGSGGSLGTATVIGGDWIEGLASNGAGFAVAVRNAANDYLVGVYEGGAWGGLQAVEDQNYEHDIRLTSNGSGYAVAMSLATSYNGVPDLFVNAYSGGSWGTNVIADASASPIASFAIVRRQSGYGVFWGQYDGTADEVWLRPYSGTTLLAAERLTTTPVGGSVLEVQLASRGGGDVMAIWTQQDADWVRLYAAHRVGNSWGAPVVLSTSMAEPTITTNGSTYMVVYAEGSAVVARRFASGWEAPTTLGSSCFHPALASNGAGYLLVYGCSGSVRARFHDGNAWDAADTTLATSWSISGTSVNSNGSGYMVLWSQYPYYGAWYPDILGRAATYAGGWSFTTAQKLMNVGSMPMVVSDHDQYLALWSAGFLSTAVYLKPFDGSYWALTDTVVAALYNDFCRLGGAASNGDGYMILYQCGRGSMMARSYKTGTLGTPVAVGGTGVGAAKVFAAGAGYVAVMSVGDALVVSDSADAWTVSLVEDRAGALGGSFDALFDGEGQTALWTEADPDDALLDRAYSRRGF